MNVSCQNKIKSVCSAAVAFTKWIVVATENATVRMEQFNFRKNNGKRK